MPARDLVCPNCGWKTSTFLSDEEIDEYGIHCKKCGAPIFSSTQKDLTP